MPAAPRQQRAGRTAPFLEREWVRRTVVVVLSIATVLGGLRVWQNVSRTRALERYIAALFKAEETLNAHLDPNSPTALDKNSRDFLQAKIDVKTFKDLSAKWEIDFKAAKDKVAALVPPSALRTARDEIVQGIDLYVGVVRLFNLAAQIREVADKQGTTGQQQVEEKVQVEMQHAAEWQSRAGVLLALGYDKVVSYQKSWGAKGRLLGTFPTPAPSPAPS